MRFFLGLVLGSLLTIGAAYVLDSRTTVAQMPQDSAIERPMVNWDVVSRNWNSFTDRMKGEWRRLSNG
jgi:hypothetical protein